MTVTVAGNVLTSVAPGTAAVETALAAMHTSTMANIATGRVGSVVVSANKASIDQAMP